MDSKVLYLRLLRYVRPYWQRFALAIAAIVITALTDPALAALIQPLLDGGFVEKDPATIRAIPALLLLLIFVKGLALLISGVSMTWVAARVVMDLRLALFNRLLTLPTTEFDNTATGLLLSKVTYDVNRVMAAATETLIILVRDSLTIIGLLAWMFYLNWALSLIVFTIIPPIMVIVRVISRRLRRLNTHMQDTMGDITRILEEAIVGHKLVKIFGGQQYEHNRFQTVCDRVRHLEVKTQVTSGLSVLIVQLLTAAALASIIYIAAAQSVVQPITVGGFVSLFTAMGLLFSPVKRLTKVNEQLQQGLAAAQSIFAVIDKSPEIDIENPSVPATQRLSGRICFQQVYFTYQGQTQPALQAISLTILPGETIALVGASGSGKTTLAHLIPRFYPVSAGQLQLDGQAINTFSLTYLRTQLALVSQEIVLFNDTVAANIAYGAMANASREQILAAAQTAHALEFIERMPQGLDTMVGERGVKLSGGQRQRLAIARALLKKAPILIFDEATSALDTQSEQAIQQALAQLKRQCTLLIIAHRLSSIVQADRVVVMDKGHIVEIGTHETLLGKQGVYSRLYQAQTGIFE